MTTPKPIADQLREAIKASGRSFRDLAKAADLPHTSVTRFAQGSGITLDSAEALAKALGIRLTVAK